MQDRGYGLLRIYLLRGWVNKPVHTFDYLIVTAPDTLRTRLLKLPLTQLVAVAAGFRPGAQPRTVLAATKFALMSLAMRYQQLTQEITALAEPLDKL
jgi:transposase